MLLRVQATLGWLVPSVCSLIASARLYSPSASLYLPCLRYTMARLLRVSPTSAWLAPNTFSLPQPFFSRRGRVLEEPLRLPVFALASIHERQVVEGPGHVGVARAECFFHDRQRALV